MAKGNKGKNVHKMVLSPKIGNYFILTLFNPLKFDFKGFKGSRHNVSPPSGNLKVLFRTKKITIKNQPI